VAQRLPKSTWRDVRYRGDPLLRPITSFEIGLLVRLLVALSMRINAALGLVDRGSGEEQGAEAAGEEPPENRLQVGAWWGGLAGGAGQLGLV